MKKYGIIFIFFVLFVCIKIYPQTNDDMEKVYKFSFLFNLALYEDNLIYYILRNDASSLFFGADAEFRWYSNKHISFLIVPEYVYLKQNVGYQMYAEDNYLIETFAYTDFHVFSLSPGIIYYPYREKIMQLFRFNYEKPRELGVFIGLFPYIKWTKINSEYLSFYFTSIGCSIIPGFQFIEKSGFTTQIGLGITTSWLIYQNQGDVIIPKEVYLPPIISFSNNFRQGQSDIPIGIIMLIKMGYSL